MRKTIEEDRKQLLFSSEEMAQIKLGGGDTSSTSARNKFSYLETLGEQTPDVEEEAKRLTSTMGDDDDMYGNDSESDKGMEDIPSKSGLSSGPPKTSKRVGLKKSSSVSSGGLRNSNTATKGSSRTSTSRALKEQESKQKSLTHSSSRSAGIYADFSFKETTKRSKISADSGEEVNITTPRKTRVDMLLAKARQIISHEDPEEDRALLAKSASMKQLETGDEHAPVFHHPTPPPKKTNDSRPVARNNRPSGGRPPGDLAPKVSAGKTQPAGAPKISRARQKLNDARNPSRLE